MAISVALTSSARVDDSGAVSISVPIPAGVIAGDKICICGFHRTGTLTPPPDFLMVAEGAAASSTNQKSYLLAKDAVGTEGGTSVTVTTSASARQSAYVVVLRSGVGTINVSQTATQSITNYDNATPMPAISESEHFAALAVGSSTYSNQNTGQNPDVGSGSAASWGILGTSTPTGTQRLGVAAMTSAGAGSTDPMVWAINQSSATNRHLSAVLVTFTEGAVAEPVVTPTDTIQVQASNTPTVTFTPEPEPVVTPVNTAQVQGNNTVGVWASEPVISVVSTSQTQVSTSTTVTFTPAGVPVVTPVDTAQTQHGNVVSVSFTPSAAPVGGSDFYFKTLLAGGSPF